MLFVKTECETKCKLLEVALRLMWEHSYGSVSVDHICKAAGVNKGSFYYFFPSKSDLTVAAMEANWQEKRPHIDRIFSSQSDTVKRLDDFAEYLYASQKAKQAEFGKVCGCPYISLGSELGTQDEKIQTKTEELIGRFCRYWETFVRDAQQEGLADLSLDPQKAALEIFSYTLGLTLQARLTNSLEPLRSAKSGIERLLGLKGAEALTA